MSIRLFGPSLASVSRLVGRPLTAIVAVALIGLSMQARMHAQERPAPPRGAEGARDPREMMKRADTDGDGKVSKAEFMAARTAELEEAFARIDADGDGRIDEAEAGRFGERMRELAGRGGAGPGGEGRRREGVGPRPSGGSSAGEPGRREGDPEGGMAEQFFERADTDGDGRLSRDEYLAAAARLREMMGRRGGPGGIGGRAAPPEEGFRKPPSRPEGS